MRVTATQMLQRLRAAPSIFDQYRMLREWETAAHNEALDYALAAVRKAAPVDEVGVIVDAVETFRLRQPFRGAP